MTDDPKRRAMPAKGLGRGLAALMGDSAPAKAAADAEPRGVREIPIEQLRPNPHQPRKLFRKEALEELAQSIREKGILQPLLLRRAGDGQGFEIIAGERRWRAAQIARLHAVPAVIKEITDRDAVEIGLIENVQREDLNPMEEAAAFRQLANQFGYSQDQIAQVIGKSRSHVANVMRLLQLPPPVIKLIIEGRLAAGQARPLIGHPLAETIAQRIVEGNLSARDVERLVAGRGPAKGGGSGGGTRAPSSGGSSSATPARKDADTLAFERSLTNALGLRAEVEQEPGKPESGRLVLHFQSLEQLDLLAKKLSR
ncbi:MAG TPA: ParB/RepB/Spo0J family partition protein [Ferrovibrio sp.]|uniref:ParB/RepB/Spo0J family partition protein n=1 Tax=Ferrovibrio sp. TaxID=1917215 RepID=UPI002B4B8B26|nr:ParB/RepB/Spo0J family partition protein [Ferrovibrio sp.]HLT77172.1 ParB/RepB/Spo0J family partition protein [Ferrovibrio sp.]